MLTNQLKEDLLQIEAETFEILDLTETAQDLANMPADDLAVAACSSSCSCSSCCSCSTSSCCSTSSSTSSCG
nr:thiazolylpeptide-type bacteriocin [Micromonospora sp. DSM 115978]